MTDSNNTEAFGEFEELSLNITEEQQAQVVATFLRNKLGSSFQPASMSLIDGVELSSMNIEQMLYQVVLNEAILQSLLEKLTDMGIDVPESTK